jgi:hypothetical protein
VNAPFYSTKVRNFGFAEGTHARKNQKLFGFSLAYSYLCGQYVDDVTSDTADVAGCSSE